MKTLFKSAVGFCTSYLFRSITTWAIVGGLVFFGGWYLYRKVFTTGFNACLVKVQNEQKKLEKKRQKKAEKHLKKTTKKVKKLKEGVCSDLSDLAKRKACISETLQ